MKHLPDLKMLKRNLKPESKFVSWVKKPEVKVRLFQAALFIANLMMVIGVGIFLYLWWKRVG